MHFCYMGVFKTLLGRIKGNKSPMEDKQEFLTVIAVITDNEFGGAEGSMQKIEVGGAMVKTGFEGGGSEESYVEIELNPRVKGGADH